MRTSDAKFAQIFMILHSILWYYNLS